MLSCLLYTSFNAKDETAKERYGVIADFMKLGGETLDEKVEPVSYTHLDVYKRQAQKKFIIFAFKKLHNATYGIFETGYGFQCKSQ